MAKKKMHGFEPTVLSGRVTIVLDAETRAAARVCALKRQMDLKTYIDFLVSRDAVKLGK